MTFAPPAEIEAIRSGLDHPIIDADGHAIEYLPVVRDVLRKQAGDDAVAALERQMRDMPLVPFKDDVWPKFLRENALRVFKLDRARR